MVSTLIVINCTNKKKEVSNSEQSHKAKVEKENISSELSNAIDSDFEIFLKRFNKDSLFQISRVKFPITYKYTDWEKDYELTEETVTKENYLIFDFEYQDSLRTRKYDKYEQFIKVEGEKATIETRGIDNGIRADYYFEKIYGKWILITWNDLST